MSLFFVEGNRSNDILGCQLPVLLVSAGPIVLGRKLVHQTSFSRDNLADLHCGKPGTIALVDSVR